MARTLRILSLVAFVASMACLLWLNRSGRIDAFVAGIHIRSHDPARLIGFAVVAAMVFGLTGGIGMTVGWVRTAANHRALRRLDRLATPLAVVMSLAVFMTAVKFCSAAAGGSDSSGYVSQADRWLMGSLRPAAPWAGLVPWPEAARTFTPLGYIPLDFGAPWRQAPVYSPGLPLLMAIAKSVGGQRGLFLVVPLSGLLLVLATYGLGLRMASRGAALAATWLVATSPVVLALVLAPMSDIPAAAAWTGAMHFACGGRARSAVFAGLCASAGVLIRPNLVFLVPLVGLWCALAPATQPRFKEGAISVAAFLSTAWFGVVAVAAFYTHLFGSPFQSGYGGFGDALEFAHVWPNLHLYSGWLWRIQPALVPLAVIGAAAIPFEPDESSGGGRRTTILGLVVILAVATEYAMYEVFHDFEWLYLRFLLPIWPLLAIFGGVAIHRLWQLRSWRLIRLATVSVVVASGMATVKTAVDSGIFTGWRAEERYPAAAELVRQMTPANSAVLAFLHSGSVRYYSGRTPIRSDILASDWLDRGVQWLAASGVRTYALLDAWEVENFRSRFHDQTSLRALETPLAVYHCDRDPAVVFLFDLTPSASHGAPREIHESDPGRFRFAPAGPVPSLNFARHGRVNR